MIKFSTRGKLLQVDRLGIKPYWLFARNEKQKIDNLVRKKFRNDRYLRNTSRKFEINKESPFFFLNWTNKRRLPKCWKYTFF